MKIRTRIAFTIVLILMSLAPARVFGEPGGNTTRISLSAFAGIKQVTITSTCDLSLLRTDSSSRVDAGVTQSVTLEASKGDIAIIGSGDPVSAGTSVSITPTDPAAIVTVDSGRLTRKYRGAIEVTLNADALRLANVISVEDYLLGVLPAEMPEAYPIESLKAQAIAARTYVLSNRRHPSEGCDLCDSTHCQMYTGVLSERPKCTQAVQETRGQIVTYNGKPASVMYSADCGGATRDYAEIQPDCNAPYLCSVTEPEDIEHTTWKLDYKLPDLEKKLVAAGVKEAAGLKSVVVGKTDSVGWVCDLTVTGRECSASIPPSKLRAALHTPKGSSALRSSLFTITQTPDGVVSIMGRGFGHGVGLCQVGAKGLALPPHNLTFDQILAHYYPGTSISGGAVPAVATADVAMISPNGQGPNPLPSPRPEAKAEVKVPDAPTPVATKNYGKPKPAQKQERLPFDVRLDAP